MNSLRLLQLHFSCRTVKTPRLLVLVPMRSHKTTWLNLSKRLPCYKLNLLLKGMLCSSNYWSEIRNLGTIVLLLKDISNSYRTCSKVWSTNPSAQFLPPWLRLDPALLPSLSHQFLLLPCILKMTMKMCRTGILKIGNLERMIVPRTGRGILTILQMKPAKSATQNESKE